MTYVSQVATRIQEGAKANVGVSAEPGPDSHLRDTVVKRWVGTPSGPAIQVGSTHPRAKMHHEGTRAHVIEPKRATVLRFKVGGATVFARRVQHPGTKPNRFLIDAATALGLEVRTR